MFVHCICFFSLLLSNPLAVVKEGVYFVSIVVIIELIDVGKSMLFKAA